MLAHNLPRVALRYAEKLPVFKVLFIKLTIKEAILAIIECIASLIGGSIAMMHLLVPQANDPMPLQVLKNTISMAIGMFTGIAMVITVDEIVKKSTALCYEYNHAYVPLSINNQEQITSAQIAPTSLSSISRDENNQRQKKTSMQLKI